MPTKDRNLPSSDTILVSEYIFGGSHIVYTESIRSHKFQNYTEQWTSGMRAHRITCTHNQQSTLANRVSLLQPVRAELKHYL